MALTVSGAGAASASSHTPSFGGSGGAGNNCSSSGVYANYCGTQKSGTGLYIAVGNGNQIIGTTHSRPGSDDFFWFADKSTSAANNDKYAEFAPNGVTSDEVIAEVNHHVVLARPTGQSNQKWVYDGTGWENVATNDVLEATTNGGPIKAVTGPSSGSSETWTFVTP